MFLPVGDEPKPVGTPYMTYGLIAANVLIYVVFCLPQAGIAADPGDPMLETYLHALGSELDTARAGLAANISAYDLFLFTHGFRPAAWSWGSLLSSMFLHSGFMHLAGNMLFLKIFGDNVEQHMGRVPFVVMYLLTGAAGTCTFALFQLDSQIPLVGASGAISGVLGCYFVWFPQHRVKLLMTFLWNWNVVRVPARFVLGFYLVVENILPLLQGGRSSVAYGAHLGGFIAGAVFARLRLTPQKRPSPKPGWGGLDAAPQIVNAPQEAPLHNLCDSQDFAAAFAVYQGLRAPQYAAVLDSDLFLLGDWLTEQHRFAEALQLLQKFIAVRPGLWIADGSGALDGDARRQALAQAHLRAGLLQQRIFARAAVALQHFHEVLRLQPHWRLAQAARQGIEALTAAAVPDKGEP